MTIPGLSLNTTQFSLKLLETRKGQHPESRYGSFGGDGGAAGQLSYTAFSNMSATHGLLVWQTLANTAILRYASRVRFFHVKLWLTCVQTGHGCFHQNFASPVQLDAV